MEFPILINWTSPFSFEGLLGGIFHFCNNLQASSGDPDQTQRCAASGLGLHYLPISHKKDARLIWVNTDKRGGLICAHTWIFI